MVKSHTSLLQKTSVGYYGDFNELAYWLPTH